MAAIRMGNSCRDLTSAMIAIVSTIPKTSTIIRVMDNGVGPVSVPIAPTSKPSNRPWNLVRSLLHLYPAVTVIASFSGKPVTPLIKCLPLPNIVSCVISKRNAFSATRCVRLLLKGQHVGEIVKVLSSITSAVRGNVPSVKYK